jgi:hypothetical protein
LAKAWLIVTFTTNTIPPVITNAGTYSSPISGLTVLPSDGCMAEVMSMEGDTYSEANQKLLEHVKKYMPWAWLWLNPSQVAHNARFKLNKYVEREVEVVANHTIMFEDTYLDYHKLLEDDK